MSKIQLTLACDTYDRTAALADGTVQPEGIDLNYIHLPVEETFWRMCQYHEFDISEMSLSSYMINLSRNDDFRAIPVFPSRVFRHDCIFINAASGIEKPQDLVGKRVGLPEYQITAAMFQRGLLQHEYGVQPTSIKWLQGGLLEPGREERTEIAYPKGISVQKIGPAQTLAQMLEDGEIDALLTARTPPNFSPDGKGPIRRLFPEFKKVEQDYYRKTGIFPIVHTVVLRKDVLDKYPWAAESMFKAFHQSKDILYKRIDDAVSLRSMLPWLLADVEETRNVMGYDFWPYGLKANRPTLEAGTLYSYEQGLTPRKFEIEELFVPSTLHEFEI